VANYNKKMKQTRIELLGFKLLSDIIEIEKQDLESKVIVAQQKILNL
jgi:hypothetical protein